MPTHELLRYEFTEDGLKQALEALGDTPDRVAENLLAMGCHGQRNNCGRCPVAVYLLRSFPDAEYVSVDPDDAVIDRGAPATELDVKIDTPDPVARFIEYFDDGEFTELVVSDAAA